jgi:hypothetical protein
MRILYQKPETLPVNSQRYAWNPSKYTKRGKIRQAWKADIARLIARAYKRIDNMSMMGVEEWGECIPDHDDLYDAYGQPWTLYYINTCGVITGKLVEE